MRATAEMLRWRARRHPSLDAVRFDGKSATFAAFNESTSQLAAGRVDKLGLQPGDALPRNAAGKLLKRTLREPCWVRHSRRIN